MRQITYVQAINETLHQLMERDSRVFLIGQGVTSPWYVGGTCNGLLDRFGPERVIDTPISENAVAGAAVGAAVSGLRPILVFPRMDFMLYAMDPIINHAAKWHYMFGGEAGPVPLVIWTIINRGGCQGAQHSQDLRWLFKKIPGLKWTNPQTPGEVNESLIDAVLDDNPVMFFDDRDRYETEGEVYPYVLKKNPGCPCPCSLPLEEEYFERLQGPLHQLPSRP